MKKKTLNALKDVETIQSKLEAEKKRIRKQKRDL